MPVKPPVDDQLPDPPDVLLIGAKTWDDDPPAMSAPNPTIITLDTQLLAGFPADARAMFMDNLCNLAFVFNQVGLKKHYGEEIGITVPLEELQCVAGSIANSPLWTPAHGTGAIETHPLDDKAVEAALHDLTALKQRRLGRLRVVEQLHGLRPQLRELQALFTENDTAWPSASSVAGFAWRLKACFRLNETNAQFETRASEALSEKRAALFALAKPLLTLQSELVRSGMPAETCKGSAFLGIDGVYAYAKQSEIEKNRHATLTSLTLTESILEKVDAASAAAAQVDQKEAQSAALLASAVRAFIAGLTEQLAAAESSLSEYLAREAELEGAVEAKTLLRKQREELLSKLQASLVDILERASQNAGSLKTSTARLETIRADLETVRGEIAAVREREEAVRKQCGNVLTKTCTFDGETALTGELLAALGQAKADLQHRMLELWTESDEQQKAIEAALASLKQLRADEELAQAQIAQLTGEAGLQEAAAIEADIKQLQGDLVELGKNIASARGHADNLRKKKQALEASLQGVTL